MRRILLLAALLFAPVLAHATIALVAVSTPVDQRLATSNTFTVTSTTGNLNVLAIVVSATGPTISSITDNKSNTWTVNATQGTFATNSGSTTIIAYSFSASTAVTSVVINFSGVIFSGVSIAFYDFSSSTGGALDTINALSTQTSANPAPSLTAAGAGAVVSVVSKVSSLSAVAAPFTLSAIGTTIVQNFGAAAYDVNASGGTLTSTYTSGSSDSWCSTIASFKESSGAPVTKLNPFWFSTP